MHVKKRSIPLGGYGFEKSANNGFKQAVVKAG